MNLKRNLENLLFYGTIIGTLYNRKPFAEKELQNCISDCIKIYEEKSKSDYCWRFKHSFLEIDKEDFKINKSTTDSLINIFEKIGFNEFNNEHKKKILIT